MDFGNALQALKEGHRVARSGWNGKGMWIQKVTPHTTLMLGGQSLNLLPYIEIKTADGGLVPWLASQTDLLADDWTIAE